MIPCFYNAIKFGRLMAGVLMIDFFRMNYLFILLRIVLRFYLMPFLIALVFGFTYCMFYIFIKLESLDLQDLFSFMG